MRIAAWSNAGAICRRALHSQPESSVLPIIHIENATFYRHPPWPSDRSNPPLFPRLHFSLPSFSTEPEFWAIVGPSSSGKTTLLEVLRGQHLCLPALARSFPYLSSDDDRRHKPYSRTPLRAIQYAGFDSKRDKLSGSGVPGAYLSARYETRREPTDFSLLDYLKGDTVLNPLEKDGPKTEDETETGILGQVIQDLMLENIVDLPVANLSNGQTRRARIAKALMQGPEVLLLDEPFMGLDPPTLQILSSLLHRLAKSKSPRIILTLRPQDPLPDWITHVLCLNYDGSIAFQGMSETFLARKDEGIVAGDGQQIYVGFQPILSLSKDLPKHSLSSENHEQSQQVEKEEMTSSQTSTAGTNIGRDTRSEREGDSQMQVHGLQLPNTEPLVQMEGVKVKYGDRKILGNWEQDMGGVAKDGLWWTVSRGDRIGIFGPNGSGKTTILSLICSDHPQTYSLPIKLFGRSRLPIHGQPGISIFDIQARIGHSSPEVHTFFPKNLTIRQTLENAWADTFLGKPVLSYGRDLVVDSCLRWFRHELDPGAGSTDLVDTLVPTYIRGVFKTLKWKKLLTTYQESDVDWADSIRLRDIPFSSQRVALFIRAIIKKPDLVILDEAFSGMDEATREKCMLFLTNGESIGMVKGRRTTRGGRFQNVYKEGKTIIALEKQVNIGGLEQRQALLCVSHAREEIPRIVKDWMCLPEPNSGKPVRFGKIGPWNRKGWWDNIWGICT